jgi:hypothetical protein
VSEHHAASGPSAEPESDPKRQYRTLPRPVHIADTVEIYDVSPVPEPVMGLDPIRDFLLRNAG